MTVPDTRELVERVRAGIGATSEGWRHRNDARDALAALAARVEELTEAAESALECCARSGACGATLRAVLVRESGGQP